MLFECRSAPTMQEIVEEEGCVHFKRAERPFPATVHFLSVPLTESTFLPGKHTFDIGAQLRRQKPAAGGVLRSLFMCPFCKNSLILSLFSM